MLDFAYIDPGAGSLLFQAIIAATLSVPFFFRNAIRTTMDRLRGTRPEDSTRAESADPSDAD